MHQLIAILRQFKEYFVLSGLVIISSFLLSFNDNPQLKEIRSYTVGFVGLFQNVLSSVPNVFKLQRENEILHQINVNLSDEVSRLRQARLENLALRSLLKLPEKSPLPLRAADIVAKSTHLMRNMVTLNVGAADSIKEGMPIISESGVVGKVIATSSQYSVGQLLLNQDFRVSAKVERSRVDGIIGWDGGENLQMKNVPKKQNVLAGDIIVTSEYSNVFPPNIRIGIVTKVIEPPGSLFKSIEVIPDVDFTRIEHVFIVLMAPDSGRTVLEKKYSAH